MRSFFQKKSLFILFAMIAIALLGSLLFTECDKESQKISFKNTVNKASAESYDSNTDTGDNVDGWAYSENIGWISFNSSNCDANNDGQSDGTNGCPSAGTSISDYGVKIDLSTGAFSGYAWSENVGWISFNRGDTGNPPSDDPGSGSGAIAVYNNITREVSGWANILSMGSDGWIRFDSTGDNSDDVHLYSPGPPDNKSEFLGWAWNGNDNGSGIGWISFNCSNDSSCGSSNYKVLAYVKTKPIVSDMSAPNRDYCTDTYLTAQLNWTFADYDGDSQSAYQIVFSKSSDFYDTDQHVFDTGKCDDANDGDTTVGQCVSDYDASSYQLDSTVLSPGQDYYWWVKVWDDDDKESDWGTSTSFSAEFTVPKHSYPKVDFTYEPSNPSVGENVQFTDASTCYNNSDNPITCDESSFFWVFQGTSPSQSSAQNPLVQFVQEGSNLGVFLQVIDGDNYSCSKNDGAVANVQSQLPSWKEVK